jgi:hypothetical protein
VTSLELSELLVQPSTEERADLQGGFEQVLAAYSKHAGCISSCARLTSLGLRLTRTGHARMCVGRHLSTMLTSLTALQRLDVASSDAHAPELGAALAALPKLEYLDVSAAPLRTLDAQMLGERMATLGQLRVLRMAIPLHARHRYDRMAALLRGVGTRPATLRQLRQLDIGGVHDMSDESTRMLADSLEGCAHVEVLSMSGFSLSEECRKVLTQGLAGMPRLRALYMCSVFKQSLKIPEIGLLALLPATSSLTQLRPLSLADSALTPLSVRALCRACAGGRHQLTALDVSGHMLFDEQADCVQQLAATFMALQKLKVQKLKLLVPEALADEGSSDESVVDCDDYMHVLERRGVACPLPMRTGSISARVHSGG